MIGITVGSRVRFRKEFTFPDNTTFIPTGTEGTVCAVQFQVGDSKCRVDVALEDRTICAPYVPIHLLEPVRGLYQKYRVTKTNGQPTDPNAQYFVLRADTDAAAREAMRLYAGLIYSENPVLSAEIMIWVSGIEQNENLVTYYRERLKVAKEQQP